MKIHTYLSSSGKDLIMEYINALTIEEQVDGLAVLAYMEKGEFEKVLSKRWDKKVYEVYFRRNNRIFYVTADSRMLVYVGGESDTWVSDALVESGNENIVAISLLDLVGNRALNEVELEGVEEHHHHDHDDEDHDHEAEPADHAEGEADNTDGQNAAEDDHYDEHVWLSLKNAIVCTETLADAITELDSDNAKQYVTNAKTYTGKLEALDDDYQTMRDAATQTTILVGDRFPFLYLAEDYDIHYFAAYSGCSADVEASVHTVTYLAEKLQEYKLQAIYVVDNGTDSLANTIAESAEMQPKILHLSSMQSVTKDDIEKGCTYLSYMEENLQMLKQGLQAP